MAVVIANNNNDNITSNSNSESNCNSVSNSNSISNNSTLSVTFILSWSSQPTITSIQPKTIAFIGAASCCY